MSLRSIIANGGRVNGKRIMSPAAVALGTTDLLPDGVDTKGTFIEGAGHGAGHPAGYRVTPRVTFITRVLVGLWLLWNAMLRSKPQPMLRVPESLNWCFHGMSMAKSSQNAYKGGTRAMLRGLAKLLRKVNGGI